MAGSNSGRVKRFNTPAPVRLKAASRDNAVWLSEGRRRADRSPKESRQIARCSGTKGSGQRSGEIDMQELKIKFPWRNADRTTGAEIATAHAMHPLKHYGYMRGTAAPWREKGAATDYAFFAQCRIRFMDVTGLARFYDYEKTLGSDSEPGPCVDHSAFWVTADERFLITTEPY
jgi:hypothetical protein